MAQAPAPIEVIRRHLSSTDARARRVALAHASAHGAAAEALAADVARLFEDDSPAVQLEAVHAFRRIGRGAADAVPVLLAMRRPGAPPMLVARATFCLGVIGPAAREATPALLAALERTPADEKILEALVAIAPDEGGVLDAVVRAALAPEHGLARVAVEALEHTSDRAIDRVFDALEARISDDRRVVALRLAAIAGKRPERAAALARELLRDRSAPEAAHAARAVAKLPAPRPVDLLDAVIDLASADGPALDVLRDLDEIPPGAERAFRLAISRNRESRPAPGAKGAGARALASAAKGLARSGANDEAAAALIAWLDRVSAAPHGASWYPVGDVVEALAALAPRSSAARAAILRVIAAARLCLDADESGVRDFEAAARRAILRFEDSDALFRAAGLSRDAPISEDEEELEPALPDFPDAASAPPRASIAPLSETDQSALAADIARGAKLIGASANDEPRALAELVDRWARRAKREGTPTTETEIAAVGALFGDALARATGWRWCRYESEPALSSPDAAHLCLPACFIARQGSDVTVLLMFEMVRAGNLPPAQAGALVAIG